MIINKILNENYSGNYSTDSGAGWPFVDWDEIGAIIRFEGEEDEKPDV